MIGEWVKGWCLIWDDRQVPDLMECDCERTGTERYVILKLDESRTVLAFGETFFYHKLPALNMLVFRLDEARRGHQEALEYIASQVKLAWEEFEQERSNGTESRDVPA